MSNEGSSKADRDLLARLNALKKTHIDLDDKQYRIPVTAHVQQPVDPSPAKALHGDLVSRFKSLNGSKDKDQANSVDIQASKDDTLANEDNKTVEELLAELSGEGAWNIEKDEATQIDDLLRSANTALQDAKSNEDLDHNQDLKPGNLYTHNLPNVDVEFHQPSSNNHSDDNDSEDESPRKSKKELEAEVTREANDIIAKLKDEVKNAPREPDSDAEAKVDADQPNLLPATPSFDLPPAPAKDPEAETASADQDLASRFASLSLPSTPSNTLPSTPSSKPGTASSTRFGATARYAGHTEEDIESWCVICCEDATLRCLGCDGDLYCAKCWIEGHRGPDAGYEERMHKASEYHRSVKKGPRRRIAA